ncbi:TPA: hypothetical protein I7730_14055 [Vibrio vulnificus]|uniref:Uncharacterized protein n=1 Tax=Vibrio vulnificus TaxID=672 RepID=A0A8H9TFI3_VIBVL|nr:hypothetical protein [Vibrio vulnificus]
MILSYETLVEQWIENGDHEALLNLSLNKSEDMSYFLMRDYQKLIALADKAGCFTTLLALLKCYSKDEFKNMSVGFLSEANLESVSHILVGEGLSHEKLANLVKNKIRSFDHIAC